VAVLNMMLYYIMQEGLEDADFIASRTEGFRRFQAKNILKLNIDELEAVSGVPREQVRAAAIAYAKAPLAACRSTASASRSTTRAPTP
jgi:formate dehydrogenase major subunit